VQKWLSEAELHKKWLQAEQAKLSEMWLERDCLSNAVDDLQNEVDEMKYRSPSPQHSLMTVDEGESISKIKQARLILSFPGRLLITSLASRK
jgi:hypothetical protein